MKLYRYTVRVDSIAHGTFDVEVTATSDENAIGSVERAEGCPRRILSIVDAHHLA